MKKPKTIGELPKDQNLGGVRFIYPGDGNKYYWHSQWQKGVLGKKKMTDAQIFPLYCESLEDAMGWRLA